MTYSILPNYTIIPIGIDFMLFINEENKKKFTELRSRYDFKTLNVIPIDENENYFSLLKNEIVFKSLDTYFKYDISSSTMTKFSDKLAPIYIWPNVVCVLDMNINYFKFIKNDQELFSLKNSLDTPGLYCFSQEGIIELSRYTDINTGSWLRCINPLNGQYNWSLDFKGEISRIHFYKNLIIFKYIELSSKDNDKTQKHNKNIETYHTIAIDGASGKEIWRMEKWYSVICDNIGTLITGGPVMNDIYEYELSTGRLLSCITIIPPLRWAVYHIDFADETAYYYTRVGGAFGKIRRLDSTVEWEFILVDSFGIERAIFSNSWWLLGNQQLLLQALKIDGDDFFTCIFDPIENLAHAKVLNGVMLTE